MILDHGSTQSLCLPETGGDDGHGSTQSLCLPETAA